MEDHVPATTTINKDESNITLALHIDNIKLKVKEDGFDSYTREPNAISSYFNFTLFDKDESKIASSRTKVICQRFQLEWIDTSLMFALSSGMISKLYSLRGEIMQDGPFGPQCKGFIEIDQYTLKNLFEDLSIKDEGWKTLGPASNDDDEMEENFDIVGDVFFSLSVCHFFSPPRLVSSKADQVILSSLAGIVSANLVYPIIPFYPSASLVCKPSGSLIRSASAPKKIGKSSLRGNKDINFGQISSIFYDSLKQNSRKNSAKNIVHNRDQSNINIRSDSQANAIMSLSGILSSWKSGATERNNHASLNNDIGILPPTPPGSPASDGSIFFDSTEDSKEKQSEKKIPAQSLLAEQLNKKNNYKNSSNSDLATDTTNDTTFHGVGTLSPMNIEGPSSTVPPTPACSPTSCPEDDPYLGADNDRQSVSSDIVPPTPCVSPESTDPITGLHNENIDEPSSDRASRLFRSISGTFTTRSSSVQQNLNLLLESKQNSRGSSRDRTVSSSRHSSKDTPPTSSTSSSLHKIFKTASSVSRKNSSKQRLRGGTNNDDRESKKMPKFSRRYSRGARSRTYMLSIPALSGFIQVIDHDREMFGAVRSIFKFSDEVFRDSIRASLQAVNDVSGTYALGKLILKKLNKEEFHLLLNMLPAYVDYVQKNPTTLLPRYYACLTIQGSNINKTAILVMTNIFDESFVLHNRITLKCVTKSTSVVTILDGTEKETVEDLMTPIEEEDYTKSEKLMVLPKDLHSRMMKQLHSDIFFLQQWQTWCYTLEVGVFYHQVDLSIPQELKKGYGVWQSSHQAGILKPRSQKKEEKEQVCKEKEHKKEDVEKKKARHARGA